ncbi:DUF6913 domain-containing protein [Algibacter mikhailovii]|uniref:DUF6913 domain-containing protein n=1 Tax=Algibacter mikhailovii TaxID=425498 RepID=UPI0024943632|nr:hypothetical protein [Algibacter mikhailovii]
MILKGFKEKSNEKYLNKLLSERHVNISDDAVISLGVVFNVDEVDKAELFYKLAEYIQVKENRVKIIAFSESKKEIISNWEECYNANDFGWNGTIKNSGLETFLDTKFDVLISFYERELLELKIITARSKAKFKIGIMQSDERVNDLIVKTSLNEFHLFKEEVFKYLKILKKIK